MKNFWVVLLLIFSSASAQTKFQKSYGDSALSNFKSYSIIQNQDSNYTIVGYDMGKIVLIYTNKFGDTIRTKSYDNSVTKLYALWDSVNNGIFIGGIAFNSDDDDLFFMKVDSIGDTVWTRRFGNVIDHISYEINGICKTSDGGFAISGTYFPFNPPPQAFIIRISTHGNIIWSKIYSNPTILVRGNAINETQDGGFILTGFYSPDFLIIKTDSLGNLDWYKSYNDPYITAICQVGITGYLLVGSEFDIYAIKTDNNGNISWSRCYGGTSNQDNALGVINTRDDGFLICGSTNSFDEDSLSKAYLIKLNSSGGLQWSRTYHSSNVSNFRSLAETNDGYIAAGYSKEGNFSDTSFMLFVSTDHQGSTGCLDSVVNTSSYSCNIITTTSTLSASDFIPQPSPSQLTYGDLTIKSITICHSIGIDELYFDKEISVYPNPVTSELSLTFYNWPLSNSYLTILNSIGQSVLSMNIESESLDLSPLPKGIYFLTIQNGLDVVSKKILKQ